MGASLLMEGFQLMGHPRLRVFVWLPILLNIFLFIALSTFLFQQFSGWMGALTDWLPDWLSFLAWIIGALSTLVILVLYGYSFSILTNLIAAPFYGILAERVEQIKTGQALSSEPIVQLILRTVGRELSKIFYFLTRSIAILLLCFIPPIGQVLSLPWSSWCMGVQYCDYAADNQQKSFIELRATLRGELLSAHGFGGLVMIGTMIPIINIFIIPAAVIGGTLLWMQLEKSE